MRESRNHSYYRRLTTDTIVFNHSPHTMQETKKQKVLRLLKNAGKKGISGLEFAKYHNILCYREMVMHLINEGHPITSEIRTNPKTKTWYKVWFYRKGKI